MRDYGTAEWDGGDPECDHRETEIRQRKNLAEAANACDGGNRMSGNRSDADTLHIQYKSTCGKCGAVRVDAQLGLEPLHDCLGWATGSPCGECYVCHMVAVFREVRRVLREDGVLWLNLGDSYAANRGYQVPDSKHIDVGNSHGMNADAIGLKPKDLCGIPWRVAFALQADGWYLRSDIIWAKGQSFDPSYVGNPMPESCKDRPTSAHEHIFLLAKSQRYYYDAAAVAEPTTSVGPSWEERKASGEPMRHGLAGAAACHVTKFATIPGGRNIRNVWSIPTVGLAEAHFATFPETLVTPMILAGAPPLSCATCGAPYRRVVQRGNSGHHCRPGCGCHERTDDAPHDPGRNQDWSEGWRSYGGFSNTAVATDDFQPSCSCSAAAPPVPAIVLDPFTGSGTVGRVALQHGRRFLGIELNPEYAAMAVRRIRSYHVKPSRPAPAPAGQPDLFSATDADDEDATEETV